VTIIIRTILILGIPIVKVVIIVTKIFVIVLPWSSRVIIRWIVCVEANVLLFTRTASGEASVPVVGRIVVVRSSKAVVVITVIITVIIITIVINIITVIITILITVITIIIYVIIECVVFIVVRAMSTLSLFRWIVFFEEPTLRDVTFGVKFCRQRILNNELSFLLRNFQCVSFKVITVFAE
jgi:hypothetical protein